MDDENILEANKALIRRWFEEVWNKRRAEAIDEMMAPGAPCHGLSDDPAQALNGPADFHPFHEVFRGALPDVNVVVEDAIVNARAVELMKAMLLKRLSTQWPGPCLCR